jgi:hypothetical protein
MERVRTGGVHADDWTRSGGTDAADPALGPTGKDADAMLHSPVPTIPACRPARRHRLVAALIAAGAGSLAGTIALPASGAAATLPARPASEFRDSIGVQTHFPFTGYAYDAAPTDELAGMLRTLGIRHLRDDLCFNTESACERVRGRLAAMQDALGPGAPRVDLMAGYSRELAAVSGRSARDADIERALTAATSAPLAPMVAGLEPVNEPDLKNTIGWTGATLADNDTFRRLLDQPRFAALRRVTHLSPAVGHATNTAQLLAAGWSRTRADIGNFHPYPPAWGGPENGLATPCGTTDALACARDLGTAAAPIATESGYSTSGTALSTSWVSEQAQGIYLPRLVLENFRSGVARTYLYELVDLKPARGSAVDGFGLYRARAAGSTFLPAGPKPAALALARMNATIGDLGAAPTGGSLDITVRSGSREVGDETIRRVLLRRADGSYVLALWQPESVWTNAVFQQRDRAVADLDVQVSIGGGPWTIRATRPSHTDAVTGDWDGIGQLALPVGPDVTLLDLSSASAGALNPAPAAPNTGSEPSPLTAPPTAASPRGSQSSSQSRAWQQLAKTLASEISRSKRTNRPRASAARGGRQRPRARRPRTTRRAAAHHRRVS